MLIWRPNGNARGGKKTVCIYFGRLGFLHYVSLIIRFLLSFALTAFVSFFYTFMTATLLDFDEHLLGSS